MLRDDSGEGEVSAWLRSFPFWTGLNSVSGTSIPIEPGVEGGGGRENVWRADVVTKPNSEPCTISGVGIVDWGCKIEAANARASLDSSWFRPPRTDRTHWGFSFE